jgi:hypothetical protein
MLETKIPTGFETFCDFICYDSIIYISHIKDGNGLNYFSIFADSKTEHDIYLLVSTDIETIKKYLKGLKTLNSIIVENTLPFYLVIVSDDDVKIEKIEFKEIEKSWIPNENVFYTFGLPKIYENL